MKQFYKAKSRWRTAIKGFSVLLVTLLSSISTLNAQVSAYTFAQSTGSFTEISGGTVLGTATGNTTATSLDDVVYPVTLPFAFNFNGVNYTDVYMSSNGFISFGNTNPGANNYTPISGTGTYGGVVSAWGRDLNTVFDIGGKTGEMSWDVIGTAPNRQVIFQWKNWRAAYSTSTTNAYVFSFQVILEETVNTVSIVYSGGTYLVGSTAISSTVQIGLRGSSNTDFNNRLNGTSLAFMSSTAGTANNSSQSFNTVNATPGMPTDGFTYTWTPPTCFAPSGFVYSAITANSASLSWSAPSTAASNGYDVYYSTTNTAPISSTVLDATNSVSVAAGVTTASLTGLTLNTPYYVWVRSKCSVSDISTWASAGSFTTDCASITTLSENFDALATGSIVPPCWVRLVPPGSTASQTITSTTSPSNPRNIYQYTATTTTPIIVVLPTMSNINAGTHWLKLKARVGSGAPGTLEVGYVTNVADASSFVLLSALTINNTDYTSGADYFVQPPTSIPANARLAIRGIADGKAYYWDDVVWEPAPSCVSPTGVTISGVTTSSFTVNYTAPVIAPANGYDIYYSTVNTAPTAATVLDATNSITSSTTSATLATATAGTTYYVWVRSNCSAADKGDWVVAPVVTTLCNVFTVPYSQNFDTTSTGSSTNTNAPNCWKYLETSGSAGYGYVTTTNNFSAPNAYYLYNSSDTTGNIMLVSPQTTNLADGNNRVRFMARGSSTITSYPLEVGTLSDPNNPASYTAISSVTVTGTYASFTVNIPAGTNQYLAFRHGLGGTYRGIYIDDVFVEVIPTCAEPTALVNTGVTTSSVNLSWTEPATVPAEGYQVYYSTSNVMPAPNVVLDATNSITSTTNTASVTGLNANTVYYFWVRSKCNATQTSPWIGSTTGYTGICLPSGTGVNYFVQNFTSSMAITNINYTGNAATTGGFVNAINTHKISGYEGSVIPISIKGNGTSTYGFAIWVDWNKDLVLDASERVFNTTAYTNLATGNITIPAGTAIDNYVARLQMNYLSSNPSNPCATAISGEHIDFTIEVVTPPTCINPTALAISNPTTTSLDLTWTAPANPPANGYEYYYSTTNTPPTSSTTASGTFAAGTTTGTITGLASSTTYYVWLRSVCSTSDKSMWSLSATGSTACSAIQAPMIMSFGNGLPNCWTNTNQSGSTSAYAFWLFSGSPGYGATNNGRPAGTYAWVDASSPYTGINAVELTTPFIDLTGLTAPAVQFEWFKNHSSSSTSTVLPPYDNNELKVEINDGDGWVTLFADSSNSPNWRVVPIILNASYIGKTVQLKFTVNKDVAGNGYFYDDVLLDEIKVIEAASLSTKDLITKGDALKVYPNPFTDVVNITNIENVKSVNVVDMGGRVVKTISNPTRALQLGDLASGAYILNISFKDGSYQSVKAIKK